MPRMGNPIRALVRLDDRVLGRWLNRPAKPASFKAVLIGCAVTVALMVLFAALTRDIFFLVLPIIPLGVALIQARQRSRE
jgi:hypothetical protein